MKKADEDPLKDLVFHNSIKKADEDPLSENPKLKNKKMQSLTTQMEHLCTKNDVCLTKQQHFNKFETDE